MGEWRNTAALPILVEYNIRDAELTYTYFARASMEQNKKRKIEETVLNAAVEWTKQFSSDNGLNHWSQPSKNLLFAAHDLVKLREPWKVSEIDPTSTIQRRSDGVQVMIVPPWGASPPAGLLQDVLKFLNEKEGK